MVLTYKKLFGDTWNNYYKRIRSNIGKRHRESRSVRSGKYQAHKSSAKGSSYRSRSTAKGSYKKKSSTKKSYKKKAKSGGRKVKSSKTKKSIKKSVKKNKKKSTAKNKKKKINNKKNNQKKQEKTIVKPIIETVTLEPVIPTKIEWVTPLTGSAWTMYSDYFLWIYNKQTPTNKQSTDTANQEE